MELKITGHRLDRVDLGGYRIARMPGGIPPAHRLLLGVSANPGEHLDVTSSVPGDLIHASNLPLLLRLFQRHRWPPTLPVRLFLTRDGREVASSLPVSLPGPAEPHTGPLLPLPVDRRSAYKYLFKKNGGKDPDGHGRTLADFTGLPGLFFFIEKGRFETERKYRGFACIGYVGAVCGLRWRDWRSLATEVDEDPESEKAKLTTFDLAKHLGATIVLREQPPDAVIRFFGANPVGYFLVWTGGHVVIVANQTVYEFTRYRKIDGYGETPLRERQEWWKPGQRFAVALLPSKPLLAQ